MQRVASIRPVSRFTESVLRPQVLWLGWVTLLVIQIFSFSSVRSDDAFISYRYGQNLASGQGLVFNPGERLLGSTSPGQMLLSAAVYWVCGRDATPSVMATLGCLAWAGQVLALFLLLTPSIGRGGAALIALVVGIGGTGAQNWVPLETNLVVACVLFAFVAADRKHWYLTAVLAAVATLLRPDAWLAALVLGGWCIWETRQRALGPVALFVVLAAVWPVFALAYYGSPVPQSALAKYHRSLPLDYLTHELTYPSSLLLPDFDATLQAIVMSVLAITGTWLIARRAPRLLPLVIYGFAHAAAYLQLRPLLPHQWHLYPWVLVTCIVCWSCLVLARDFCVSRQRRALGAVCTAVMVLLLASQALDFARSTRELDAGYWTGQRHATYLAIAKYLKEHTPKGQMFGSVEVGTLAYYSNVAAFDFGGLVTRPSERLDKRPVRYLVVDKVYIPRGSPVRPAFQSQHGDFFAVVYQR